MLLQNIIESKWIFTLKKLPGSTLYKRKSRLVAKGFAQTPGFNFSNTFSLVAKQVTIRIVLTVALSTKWNLHQLDINNAFINGHLQEELFMIQPKRFEDLQFPNYVCKSHKAIYGLKQGPRAWFVTFTSIIILMGFHQSKADLSLFFKHTPHYTIYLLVNIDNIIITGSDDKEFQFLIITLNKKFALKYFGLLSFFLGIEVSY